MQAADLKNPGIDQLAQTTRMNVAALISNVENETNPSGDVAAFLSDAATKTPGYTGPALPATQAVVSDGVKVDAMSVTGTGNFATFSVANGVITGIVLSAS